MSATHSNVVTAEGKRREQYAWYVVGDRLAGVGGDATRLHHGDPLGMVEKLYPGSTWKRAWADRNGGTYYPQIHMGPREASDSDPPLTPTRQRALIMAVEREEILSDDLRAISRVVTPSDATKKAYGSKIRNLLVMACTEVEAQCKAILCANDYKTKAKDQTMKDYVKLAAPLRLDKYLITCDRFPDYPHFSPFKGWKPGVSLPWYKAYNETKHDADSNAPLATLEHAISAVGAVATLIIAQYGGTYLDQVGSLPFFGLVDTPHWSAQERNYAPAPGDRWTPFPYPF